MLKEEKLKKIVSLMVDRKMEILKEGAKFQAIRSLTIQAQQTAMKFEEEMVDSLEIKSPDDLPDDEQAVYAQAMADMHAKMIEAVVHAANVLKSLSSKPKEEAAPKKKQASTSSPALDQTVKDLTAI
jgi:hypothetical protein